MKFKPFSIAFLISLVLYLACCWIRGGYIDLLSLSGISLASLVYGITYYILTVILLRKFREKLSTEWVVIAILLGAVILELPYWTFCISATPGLWPEIFVRLLAIGGGYLCWKISGRVWKVVVSGVFLAFCLWISYSGYDLWVNKMYYGTWTGRLDPVTDVGMIGMQTPEEETVRLEKFRGRYVVLDFISSSCGVCIRKLPLVQELQDTYADNPQVEVYVVFCRDTARGESPAIGAKGLTERGYHIPLLSIPMDDPNLKEVFGVEKFPDVQVVDPEGKIVFRGRIENAGDFLSRSLGR